jgi:hypothetical protein
MKIIPATQAYLHLAALAFSLGCTVPRGKQRRGVLPRGICDLCERIDAD